MTCIKAHPAAVFGFIAPFWIITLFPFFRRIFIKGGGAALAAAELIGLFIIFLQAYLRARALEIEITETRLVIKKGVFIKGETIIKKHNVSCLSFKTNPILWLLSAETVSIDTEAGKKHKSEHKMLIKRADATALRSALGLCEGIKSFKMGAKRVTLMAAAVSSAAVGVLVAVPAINRIGRVLDKSFAGKIIETVRSGALFSSAFAAISLLFLFFYAVSFIFLLIRNISMQIGLTAETIYIGAGIFPRRRTYFKKESVGSIVLEQRPIIRLSGRYIIKVGVAGYGGRRDDSVIVPVARKSEVEPFLRHIFSLERPNGGITPARHLKYRFIRWRMLFSAAVPAAIYFLGCAFPVLWPLSAPLSVIILISLLYFLSLGFLNSRTARLSKSGDYLFAAGVSGFRVKEFFCRRERVGMFLIRRYPTDIRKKTAILKIETRNENSEKMKVKYISYLAAQEYCKGFWKQQ